MTQPQFEIAINKQKRIVNIVQINWNHNKPWCILVDFYGDGQDKTVFYDYEGLGEFTNVHGNLKGKIIE